MPTIELPDFWLLVNPENKADGSLVAVRGDSSVCAASAEQAWAQLTPLKRDRDREARAGWRIVGVDQEGWERHFRDGAPVPASTDSSNGDDRG